MNLGQREVKVVLLGDSGIKGMIHEKVLERVAS